MKVKILIVDDEVKSRESARSVFHGKNVDLLCTDCFSTAEHLLKNQKHGFDMVLTDLMLIGEDFNISEDHPDIGQETPYGLILAILAKNIGVPHVAILSTDRHSGPLPGAVSVLWGKHQFINAYNHKDWLLAAQDFVAIQALSENKEKSGASKRVLIISHNPGYDELLSNQKREKGEMDIMTVPLIATFAIEAFLSHQPDFTLIIGELTGDTRLCVQSLTQHILSLKTPHQKIQVSGTSDNDAPYYLKLPVPVKKLFSFIE